MSKAPQSTDVILATLRKALKRGLWVWLGTALFLGILGFLLGTLEYDYLGWIGLTATVWAALIFLVSVLVDISRAILRKVLPLRSNAERRLARVRTWVAVIVGIAAIPLLLVASGGWYAAERNSDYEMFAAGEKLGEMLLLINDYHARNGRFPASHRELGLSGSETLKYKKFDLEVFGDLPVDYSIAAGKITMSVGSDHTPTVSLSPELSGDKIDWTVDKSKTSEGRHSRLVLARATGMLSGQAEERPTPRPECEDGKRVSGALKPQVAVTTCGRRPG